MKTALVVVFILFVSAVACSANWGSWNTPLEAFNEVIDATRERVEAARYVSENVTATNLQHLECVAGIPTLVDNVVTGRAYMPGGLIGGETIIDIHSPQYGRHVVSSGQVFQFTRQGTFLNSPALVPCGYTTNIWTNILSGVTTVVTRVWTNLCVDDLHVVTNVCEVTTGRFVTITTASNPPPAIFHDFVSAIDGALSQIMDGVFIDREQDLAAWFQTNVTAAVTNTSNGVTWTDKTYTASFPMMTRQKIWERAGIGMTTTNPAGAVSCFWTLGPVPSNTVMREIATARISIWREAIGFGAPLDGLVSNPPAWRVAASNAGWIYTGTNTYGSGCYVNTNEPARVAELVPASIWQNTLTPGAGYYFRANLEPRQFPALEVTSVATSEFACVSNRAALPNPLVVTVGGLDASNNTVREIRTFTGPGRYVLTNEFRMVTTLAASSSVFNSETFYSKGGVHVSVLTTRDGVAFASSESGEVVPFTSWRAYFNERRAALNELSATPVSVSWTNSALSTTGAHISVSADCEKFNWTWDDSTPFSDSDSYTGCSFNMTNNDCLTPRTAFDATWSPIPGAGQAPAVSIAASCAYMHETIAVVSDGRVDTTFDGSPPSYIATHYDADVESGSLVTRWTNVAKRADALTQDMTERIAADVYFMARRVSGNSARFESFASNVAFRLDCPDPSTVDIWPDSHEQIRVGPMTYIHTDGTLTEYVGRDAGLEAPVFAFYPDETPTAKELGAHSITFTVTPEAPEGFSSCFKSYSDTLSFSQTCQGFKTNKFLEDGVEIGREVWASSYSETKTRQRLTKAGSMAYTYEMKAFAEWQFRFHK